MLSTLSTRSTPTPRLAASLPCRVPSAERLSSSACALAAAEGLIMMSTFSAEKENTARNAPPVPTAAVYCPGTCSEGTDQDVMSIMTMFTAQKDELLAPHLKFWPSLLQTKYARVCHAVLLPCDGGESVQDSMLVWFTEECMDVRPVTKLARKLRLRTTEGALVQGPIVVCTFRRLDHVSTPLWYGLNSPTLYGVGDWVHVPTLSKCVSHLCASIRARRQQLHRYGKGAQL